MWKAKVKRFCCVWGLFNKLTWLVFLAFQFLKHASFRFFPPYDV